MEQTLPESTEVHWGYEGTEAPEFWGDLHPDFAQCTTGNAQSPINLGPAVAADLGNIEFAYGPSAASLVDNGHTLQIAPATLHFITLNGEQLNLLQMHLHTPSEHLAEGSQYPGEAHFVHTDAEGNLTVVGVLLEEGEANPVLDYIIGNAPQVTGEENHVAEEVDLTQLLPENRVYKTYLGSLTTPPCTEQVTWIVFDQPVQASAEQIAELNAIMGNNNRPVQDVNQRQLLIDATP